MSGTLYPWSSLFFVLFPIRETLLAALPKFDAVMALPAALDMLLNDCDTGFVAIHFGRLHQAFLAMDIAEVQRAARAAPGSLRGVWHLVIVLEREVRDGSTAANGCKFVAALVV